MLIKIIKSLIHKSASFNIPAGNITILAISAANIEYAMQLNHLNILEFELIFFAIQYLTL